MKKKSSLSHRRRDFLGLGLIFSFFILLFYFLILKDLPLPTNLSSQDISQTTQILDRNGKLLYKIYTDQNRTLVKLSEIPLSLRQATISIEDKDFYKQGGFAYTGILRAFKEIIVNHKLQGGSTLTQQLVKNALLTPQRTIQRKIKEAFLSYFVDKLYTKDQILEMYFNQVPYGGTAWGVEAAANMYFGKKVSALSLAESSFLAGLPAAPTYYSPYGSHPEFAKDRQAQVLRRMTEDGYITKKQADETKKEKIIFKEMGAGIKAPHFVMFVKDQLERKYGEKLVERGGLKVTTTLDLGLQDFSQNTVATEVAKLKDLQVGNAAALITRPPTGEILAMVGSKDYFSQDEDGNVNITTSLRQPGSSIKPINYAIGLETRKITPASLFLDIPTCFSVLNQPLYCPQNYDGKFHGPVQVRFALGNSYNLPAVKMLSLNSVETMVASASAMGITTFKDPAKYGLSLTLGGGEVMMTDLSVAFGVFSNTGIKKDLVSVLKVEDHNAKILEEFKDPNFKKDLEKLPAPSTLAIAGPKVLSTETSFLISHILLDNNGRSAAFGEQNALVIPGRAVSVKTGTTDDKRDNWTIGFTPNFLVAAWVGNNDNRPMNPALTSGVTGAAPIWHKIMVKVLEKQIDLWPKKPEGVVGAQVCAVSWLNHAENSCPTRFEYFIEGTVPKETENLKKNIWVEKGTGRQSIFLDSQNPQDNLELKEKQIVSDPFTDYCLDCPHDTDKPVIVK